jgi:hypothetical protein
MKRLLASTAAFLALSQAAFAQEAVSTAAPADSAAASAEAVMPPADQVVAPPAADTAVASVEAAPAADPNVYQVLRTGDREMSCEQLSAEANALNARLLADQKAASKKAGRSRAGRAAGGAVAGGTMRAFGRFGINRIAGSLGPVGFIAAHAANDAASRAAAQTIANGGEDQSAPSVTPEQQRMNHLLGLYKEKSC